MYRQLVLLLTCVCVIYVDTSLALDNLNSGLRKRNHSRTATYRYTCKSDPFNPGTPPAGPVERVELHQCAPPPGAMQDALALHHPRAFRSLAMLSVPHQTHPLTASLFKHLHRLLELQLETNDHYNPQLLGPGVFDPLVSLTSLKLRNMIVPPLPAWSRLERASFFGGRALGGFGGCSELKELHLTYWSLNIRASRGSRQSVSVTQAPTSLFAAVTPSATVNDSVTSGNTLDMPVASVNIPIVMEANLKTASVGMRVPSDTGAADSKASLELITTEATNPKTISSRLEDTALAALTGASENFTMYPHKGYLEHCRLLRELYVHNSNFKMINELLRGVEALHKLSLKRCKLRSSDIKALPIVNMRELQRLSLTYNVLDDVNSILETATRLPKLTELNLLHNNDLNDFCNHLPTTSKALDGLRQRVRWLSIRATATSDLCFGEWKALEMINASANYITRLKFSQLPLQRTSLLVVDLRDNPLRGITFLPSDYKRLVANENASVTVFVELTKPLKCDCHLAWLARALRERRVAVPGLRCSHGQDPSLLAMDEMDPCEPRCDFDEVDDVANCNSLGLLALPHLSGQHTLDAAGNAIQTILASDLPDDLILLNVRNNNISRLDKSAVRALFKLPERRVRLGGNPLACDCSNWPLIDDLRQHSKQVLDYNDLLCNMEYPFRDLVLSKEECDRELQEQTRWESLRQAGLAVTAAGGVALGLIALLASLYCRYERQVKVYLFSRGCCMSWLREEEVDSDRIYDAFVSFAHDDVEFVREKLLPRLEGGPRPYATCVHYRDWQVGELIPAQIARSVAQSRRTIVVLSRNFVRSVWGLLEFRTAHVSAVHERRMRVIAVIIDDVVDDKEDIDEELRNYLHNNTYVRWGEPWFWDKLLYAMPHLTPDSRLAVGYSAKKHSASRHGDNHSSHDKQSTNR